MITPYHQVINLLPHISGPLNFKPYLFIFAAKYDVAISMSCGGLDYIVVETAASAQTCVELLRARNLGVATFLILVRTWLPQNIMRTKITCFTFFYSNYTSWISGRRLDGQKMARKIVAAVPAHHKEVHVISRGINVSFASKMSELVGILIAGQARGPSSENAAASSSTRGCSKAV